MNSNRVLQESQIKNPDTRQLTDLRRWVTIPPMIETIGFVLGFGFSVLVYVRSIRTAKLSWQQKAYSALFTFIGITGMVFLASVLIAHTLRKYGIL